MKFLTLPLPKNRERERERERVRSKNIIQIKNIISKTPEKL